MRFAARMTALFLLAGCCLFAGVAVQNFSFEDPVESVASVYVLGTQLTGWHTPGGWLYRPPAGDFTNLGSDQVVGSGTFWQDVGAIEAGTTYRLTVLVGNRVGPDSSQTYSISLLAFDGSTTQVMGSVGGAISGIADGEFVPVYLDAVAASQYQNQTLRIQLSSSGTQANFDDVSLADAPEPSTLGFLALGGGLLALLRRRP